MIELEKLPKKLLSEIGSEKIIFNIHSGGLNIISFAFAVFCFIIYIVGSFYSGAKIRQIIVVGFIILLMFVGYYVRFKNDRYFVGLNNKLIIYKNNTIEEKQRSDFSGNMEIISNTEINLELTSGNRVYYEDGSRKYKHNSIYIWGIKNIKEIAIICKQKIGKSDNDSEYTINTVLPSSIMNLTSKIITFIVFLIAYTLLVGFITMLAIASYDNYSSLIAGLVLMVTIFAVYYAYKFIFSR